VVGGKIIVMKKLLLVVGLVFSSSLFARCISGDCNNGFGTYVFKSGNVYIV